MLILATLTGEVPEPGAINTEHSSSPSGARKQCYTASSTMPRPTAASAETLPMPEAIEPVAVLAVPPGPPPAETLEMPEAIERAPDGMDPRLEQLRTVLRGLGSVLVCYSGGVDSALVLAVAHEVLGGRAVGMTAVSPSLAAYEKEAATAVAKQIGARHELVESQEIERPGYVANAPDRCFHCKSELYAIAARKAREWDLAAVVNGTNLDDLGDYRPGLEAATENDVRSVLVECGFHKEDVRRCASAIGLTIWDKPASACLSSRIPYGTAVTRERLAQIGGLEAELRALGLRQVRVRWHGLGDRLGSTSLSEPALARIEVDRDALPHAFELREAIVGAGKRFGFSYVTIDLQGYRTGSHNEVLVGKTLRVV